MLQTVKRRFQNSSNGHEVSAHIVEGIILEPECLCTVGAGVNEMPTTAEGWDAMAKDLAQKEPLAVLSIEASDAALKEEIRLVDPRISPHAPQQGGCYACEQTGAYGMEHIET